MPGQGVRLSSVEFISFFLNGGEAGASIFLQGNCVLVCCLFWSVVSPPGAALFFWSVCLVGTVFKRWEVPIGLTPGALRVDIPKSSQTSINQRIHYGRSR